LVTTTIEGIFVSLDVIIFWNIVDSEKAAKTAFELFSENQEYSHLN
jgi:hypothetical protein